MIRSTLTVLLVYGCLAGNSYAQPGSAKPSPKPDEPPPKGLRVFFASHSLMWYAPKPLGEMAAAAGIKDHKLVGLQSLGTSKTLQHWKLPDDKNQAKKALKTGEVDVFVMSPISFPDEGIENFIKLGLRSIIPTCDSSCSFLGVAGTSTTRISPRVRSTNRQRKNAG